MVKGIYRSAGGMIQKLFEQDIISNNIANVNTTGFKKDSAFLQDVIDAQLALQVRTGEGTFIADNNYSTTSFEQGQLIPTGSPLDVGIDGKGFFVIQAENGERYTRDGNFKLNLEGQLVTNNGDAVMGQGGEITIDGGNVTIGSNGEVFADGEPVDIIKIIAFEDSKTALRKEGNSLYSKTSAASEVEAEEFKLLQGFKEGSNINIVSSMVNMIDIHRTYEANEKALKASDESLKMLVTQVGRY